MNHAGLYILDRSKFYEMTDPDQCMWWRLDLTKAVSGTRALEVTQDPGPGLIWLYNTGIQNYL